MKRFLKYAVLCAAVLFAAASVFVAVRNGMREFDFQWDPAKLLMMGDNPYRYSLENKAVEHPGFMTPWIDANQLPSCLLLLAPWTILPQLLANQVWAFCNLAFTAAFLFFVWRMFFADGKGRGPVFFALSVVLLSGAPWRVLVGNGQHLMFSLAFFMAVCFCASGKAGGGIAGVLLALSAFKYTTVAPLAFVFVMKKCWKPLFVAAGLHIVATVGAGIHLGESPVSLVLQSLEVGAKLTGQGDSDLASLAAVLGSDSPMVWSFAGYVLWSMAIVSLLFVKRFDFLLALSCLAAISNVMFYHRIYDFVTLLFPLMYLVRRDRKIPGFLAALILFNVVWAFYVQSVLRRFDRFCPVEVSFLGQNLLAVALIVELFRSGRSDDASSPSVSGC